MLTARKHALEGLTTGRGPSAHATLVKLRRSKSPFRLDGTFIRYCDGSVASRCAARRGFVEGWTVEARDCVEPWGLRPGSRDARSSTCVVALARLVGCSARATARQVGPEARR